MDTRTKKIGSILSIVIIVSVVLVVILVLPPPGGDGPDDTPHSQWIWISGNYTVNTPGTYGVKGAADAANVPGAREGPASWTDVSGNFWLFGGYGVDNTSTRGRLNDLWRFNVGAATWTWVSGHYAVDTPGTYGVKGAADAANVPGARRGAASCTDASGNFWLFGGYGYGNTSTRGRLNDLWRFNVGDATWTWVSGNYSINNLGTYGEKGVADAANVPGAREDPVSWTDASGNFWLFGGWGYDNTSVSGHLNDLWRFNVSATTWTWVSGHYVRNTPGTYGVKGVADAANVPGARYYSTSWTDASGNFWLFGGDGVDNASASGELNDLWRFNVSATTWTWVSGHYARDTPGTYGVKGVADAANVPGGRLGPCSCTDASGNFWLFGGWGYDNASTSGELNDLWRFNVSAATWTWVSGNYTTENLGTYGVQGVADAANVPGARKSPASWTDASGNFWLFGGFGYGNAIIDDNLNDLWKFQV